MSRSFGGTVVHDLIADRDRAVGDALQPGDHPERRRLAAPDGPTSTMNSWSRMSSERSETAVVPSANTLETPSITIVGHLILPWVPDVESHSTAVALAAVESDAGRLYLALEASRDSRPRARARRRSRGRTGSSSSAASIDPGTRSTPQGRSRCTLILAQLHASTTWSRPFSRLDVSQKDPVPEVAVDPSQASRRFTVHGGGTLYGSAGEDEVHLDGSDTSMSM